LSLKNDLVELLENLEQGIFQGDELQGFSGKVYKSLFKYYWLLN